jgi:sodium-dependent dicarboxylate transporter 2/3/5
MPEEHGEVIETTGILANKKLWMGVGFGLLILIGFLIPSPQSMKKIVEENGYAEAMFAKGIVGEPDAFRELYLQGKISIEDEELKKKVDEAIEKNWRREWSRLIKDESFIDLVMGHPELREDIVAAAAWKAKFVVALTVCVVIFFATDAMPIGVAALLIPTFGYLVALDGPRPSDIAKDFFSDAAVFLLGVLALGYGVAEVGLHSRIAVLILGKFRGFKGPLFGLTIIMAVVGSFISAHALAAFLAPVMAAVYYGSVRAAQKSGQIEGHDRELAKMLLIALTYAMNVGGTGSPIAGGRNAIMMEYFDIFNVPISFIRWMIYGLPMVPVLGALVGLYCLLRFKPTVRDLTPGIEQIKQELKEKGPMDYREKVMAFVLVLVLVLWIVPEMAEGLGIHLPIGNLGIGGPALFALVLPPLLGVVNWEKMLKGLSWDAWFVYIAAIGLGSFMKNTGAALWIAKSFMELLPAFFTQGLGLWMSVSLLSGTVTNFMSDAATTALIGPITIQMGLLSGHPWEPWAAGLATAFATSYAHFLIIGTPNNVIVYALGRYPDTGERILSPTDFVRYGIPIFFASLIIMWVLTFVVVFSVVGFPEGLLETAKAAASM